MEHDSKQLRVVAGELAKLIQKHHPYALKFLCSELEEWIDNSKSSPFPISDNDYGEAIDAEIDIHEAAVILIAIHDKHGLRVTRIGQYDDSILKFTDSGKLSKAAKKSIAYYALLENVPDSITDDDMIVLEDCLGRLENCFEELSDKSESQKNRQAKKDKATRESFAIALTCAHPEYTLDEIAKHLRISKRTLHNYERFKRVFHSPQAERKRYKSEKVHGKLEFWEE